MWREINVCVNYDTKLKLKLYHAANLHSYTLDICELAALGTVGGSDGHCIC